MAAFDRLADLPLTVESYGLERLERDTSSDFTRVTTVVSLEGDGVTGRGEDVTYEPDEHEALATVEREADGGPFPLPGEWTLASFSAQLDEIDLFPGREPDMPVFRNYRRWGFESAALDLALRQAGTDLASALDRSYEPVRFVVSTRLGDPPTTDRVDDLLDRDSSLEFKLDPTPEWTPTTVDRLVETDAVRILDFKGHYEGTDVDNPPSVERYRRLLETFPDAVIEDPALTDETRPLFEDSAVAERVSWDAPIHGIDDVRELPWEPSWLNVKPSRFGSLESLLETIDYCHDHRIRLYGGGQFELGVGREHIQALGSLFYPDGPNDVAPRGYNLPDPPSGLPSSPLEPPEDVRGFSWPVGG